MAARNAEKKGKEKLSALQQRFVDEFVADEKLCAKAAAIRAGYSEKTAESQASRLLSLVKVQEAIAAAREARSQRTQITQDVVLRRIDALSRASLGEVASWKDNQLDLIDSDKLTPEQKYMIESITMTPTEWGQKVSVKVRRVDDALKLLAEHTGITEPKDDVGSNELDAALEQLEAEEQKKLEPKNQK